MPAATTVKVLEKVKQFQQLFTVIPFNVTIDVGDLADNAGETVSVTGVTGAALGDFVLVTPIIDAIDLTWTAYVQAADTVEIVFTNVAAGANRNLDSTTFRGVVLKPTSYTTNA